MKEFVYEGKNILISSISETLHAKIKYDAHLWIEDGVVVKNHTGWDEEKLKTVLETFSSSNFYFVYYECNIVTSGVSTKSYNQKCQRIINEHPLRWQIEVNKKYNKFREVEGNGIKKKEYIVINWKELTIDEYLEFKGYF